MNSVCLLHFQRRKQNRSTLPPSNLPTVFSFGTNGNIRYIYTATGTKLSKVVTNGSTVTTTDYDGNYIYTNSALSQILQPQGYIVPNNGTYMYYFQYKDNLGSNRLTYFDNNGDGTISSSEIAEEDNYYPYGMLQTGYNNIHNGTGSNFKYNGKELQDDAVGSYHLNLYDYGARFYDPALGRWTTPDPLAENYNNISPYTYVGNNPIKNIDINGDSLQVPQPTLQKVPSLTLTQKDASFVRYDKNGKLNVNLINKHSSKSGNYNALKEIANSPTDIVLTGSNKFTYKDDKGNIITVTMPPVYIDPSEPLPNKIYPQTGEHGWFGQTQTPGNSPDKYNSPDNKVHVTLNISLSEAGLAQTYSHEVNGHVLLYIQHKPYIHMYKNVNGHVIDENKLLVKYIVRSIQETITNMK